MGVAESKSSLTPWVWVSDWKSSSALKYSVSKWEFSKQELQLPLGSGCLSDFIEFILTLE